MAERVPKSGNWFRIKRAQDRLILLRSGGIERKRALDRMIAAATAIFQRPMHRGANSIDGRFRLIDAGAPSRRPLQLPVRWWQYFYACARLATMPQNDAAAPQPAE
jgi:hypothetical protein